MGSRVLGQFQLHREQPWGVGYRVNFSYTGSSHGE